MRTRPFARALTAGFAGIALVAGTLLIATPAAAAVVDVYDSIPAPLPGNLGSLSFQAQATSEFGQRVQVSTPGAVLDTLTVGFSTWACETGGWTSGCVTTPGASYAHPITVTVYSVVAGAPGPVLATSTESVDVPYRPSANTADAPNGCGAGSTRWHSAADGICYNGMLFTWDFDLSSSGVVLPAEVAFSTNTYGAAPIGANGPYESLNVALGGTVSVGTLPDPDQTFWNSTAGGRAPGFAASTGWTANGAVMLALSTTVADPARPAPAPAPALSGSGAGAGR